MWLEGRLGEPITQQEAAARVKMSPAAFSRWFKVNMGCVFNRYLNEIRVAKVCAEIANGRLSITEAAFQAGYNNLSVDDLIDLRIHRVDASKIRKMRGN